VLGAFLATILFSISAICGNRASKLLGGTEANFWRLLFATLLLAAYAHLLGQGFSGPAFRTFFISGCIGFGVGDLALFQALPRIGSRLSVMLVLCLSSPLGAALEWFWMRTALSGPEIWSAVVVLIGVAVALAPSEHLDATRPVLWTGVTFGLLAAICQALGAVLSRQAFAEDRAGGLDIDGVTAAYQRILGGVLVTGVFLAMLKLKPIPVHLHKPDQMARLQAAIPLVLLNGLAGPALGVSCYQWALKNAPTGIVLPIVATTPVIIIPFSFLFEKERPSKRSLLGGIMAVLGAVALAMFRNAGR
jgi:drug/metabolite transporter (DMT)-like permease